MLLSKDRLRDKNKSFLIEILIRKLKNKGGQMRHPLKHQDTESLGKGN